MSKRNQGKRIDVYFTEKEVAQIKEDCARLGITMSEYVRRALDAAPYSVLAVPGD